MGRILSILIFCILSALCAFFSAKHTNSLIEFSKSKNEELSIKKYDFNSTNIIMLIGLVLVSGYISFVQYSSNIDNSVSVLILSTIRLLICLLVIVAAAIYDGKLRIIPNYLPFSLIVAKLIFFIAEFFVFDDFLVNALSSIVGLAATFIVLTIANKLSHDGIGAGDIKLLSALGFFAGFSFVVTLSVFSLLACSIISIALIGMKKLTMKDSLPFAPFILIGFLIISCLSWI